MHRANVEWEEGKIGGAQTKNPHPRFSSFPADDKAKMRLRPAKSMDSLSSMPCTTDGKDCAGRDTLGGS